VKPLLIPTGYKTRKRESHFFQFFFLPFPFGFCSPRTATLAQFQVPELHPLLTWTTAKDNGKPAARLMRYSSISNTYNSFES
jgi:hypothetical protein